MFDCQRLTAIFGEAIAETFATEAPVQFKDVVIRPPTSGEGLTFRLDVVVKEDGWYGGAHSIRFDPAEVTDEPSARALAISLAKRADQEVREDRRKHKEWRDNLWVNAKVVPAGAPVTKTFGSYTLTIRETPDILIVGLPDSLQGDDRAEAMVAFLREGGAYDSPQTERYRLFCPEGAVGDTVPLPNRSERATTFGGIPKDHFWEVPALSVEVR